MAPFFRKPSSKILFGLINSSMKHWMSPKTNFQSVRETSNIEIQCFQKHLCKRYSHVN